MRSKPMPVSTCWAGSGVSLPSASRLYWMKTRFQISMTRGSSPLTCWAAGFVGGAVDVDFGAGAAGAGVAHFPEVVLAEVVNVIVGQAGDFFPEIGGFGVARNAVLFDRLRNR